MKVTQLEHLIRAAGAIAQENELAIIGSQAILGAYPNAPEELVVSVEADLFPLHHPEKADLIDGSIGELSPFHELYGYYAHGVGPETALLPRNWKGRLIPVRNENTNGITGWCLSPADLAISKLLAQRPKDIRFVAKMIELQMVYPAEMKKLIPELPDDQAPNLSAWFASLNQP